MISNEQSPDHGRGSETANQKNGFPYWIVLGLMLALQIAGHFIPVHSWYEWVGPIRNAGRGAPEMPTGVPEAERVRSAYLDLLGREPDAAGLQMHIDLLRHGLTEAELRQNFMHSREYAQARNHFFRSVSLFGKWPTPVFVVYLLLLSAVIAGYRFIEPRVSRIYRACQRALESRRGALLAALGCGVVFFLLRNHFVNPDGMGYPEKFERDVPLHGSHLYHDDMLELYVHSRFWYWTNQLFGWNVIFSYQVASCLAGIAFVYVALRFFRALLPERFLALALLFACGGFIQLYFGDAENYSLVTLCILIYYYYAWRLMQGTASLCKVATLFGIAVSFHFLAGALTPHLVFLGLLQLKRKQYRDAFLAPLCSVLPVALTLAWCHINGLPIQNLFQDSHISGYGNSPLAMIAEPSFSYYWQQLNILLILCPGVLLLVPLITGRRIAMRRESIGMLIAAACYLTLQALWYAKIGVFNDWNLFANAGMALQLLIWFHLVKAPSFTGQRKFCLVALLVLGAMTMAWIAENHFIGR